MRTTVSPILVALVLASSALSACSRGVADEATTGIAEGSGTEVVAAAAPPDEGSAEPVVDPTPPPPPEPVEHVVQPGDTFWGLAVESGCSVDEIKRASGIQSDIIYPGQTLLIPPCGDDAPEVQAAPTPTRPDQAVAGEYTVEPGDYLERIAIEHGCSVSELMAANDMRSDVIYAGRTLQIPECSGEEAPLAAAEPTEGQYRVRPGDYLFAIASSHGCSLNELMRANNLTSDFIQAGAILQIPTDCTGESSGPPIIAAVDHSRLRDLMEDRGFRPPRDFMALVIEFTFDSGRTRVTRERRFDWEGTSDDADGWNPASTVKLFAAIAAMQRARDLGFTGDALVTFHGGRDYTTSLDELVSLALGPSDNIAYNRLVQFVGYDEMNAQFLSRRNGLAHTALRRPYAQTQWMEMGQPSSFRETPALTIREGGRTRTLDARSGSAATPCGGAACTTLADLAEAMRRLMLQEQLRESDSYNLPRADLLTIRRALRTDRDRGDEVVDALAGDFPTSTVFYHKAGYSNGWYSDNVYIFDPTQNRAFIVTMAGNEGRSSLTRASAIIGDILADGAL